MAKRASGSETPAAAPSGPVSLFVRPIAPAAVRRLKSLAAGEGDRLGAYLDKVTELHRVLQRAAHGTGHKAQQARAWLHDAGFRTDLEPL